MDNERRKGARLQIELFVDEKTDGELYFQRTANLSKGGMYLENTIPHPLGTLINVEFTLPGDNEKIQAKGEIVSASTEGPGMGLKFVNLQPRHSAKIDAFVARIQSAQKPGPK